MRGQRRSNAIARIISEDRQLHVKVYNLEGGAKGWYTKDYINPYIAHRLETLTGFVVLQEEWAWAAQLWGAAEILREVHDVPLPLDERADYEQAVADAYAQLGEEGFARA